MIASIGDTHGCAQELREMIAKLLLRFGDTPSTIVMVGDYIDRGPDSRGVIDILRNWNHPTVRLVTLRGNHDEMMIRACLYDDKDMEEIWLTDDSGGAMTVMSMGAEINEYAQWMDDNLVDSYEEGNLFFCHAGVDPDYDLKDQIADDLLWIREPFLSHRGSFGKVVVHGHSPAYGAPEIKSNRVNVDTGCVFGGILSAVVFDNDIVVAIETVDPHL